MQPEYAKAAEIVLGDDPAIAFVKTDCEGGGIETCKQNDIKGYPTLKIFKNGKFLKQYDGPRDADGIVKYMREEVGPSADVGKLLEILGNHLEQNINDSLV